MQRNSVVVETIEKKSSGAFLGTIPQSWNQSIANLAIIISRYWNQSITQQSSSRDLGTSLSLSNHCLVVLEPVYYLATVIPRAGNQSIPLLCSLDTCWFEKKTKHKTFRLQSLGEFLATFCELGQFCTEDVHLTMSTSSADYTTTAYFSVTD